MVHVFISLVLTLSLILRCTHSINISQIIHGSNTEHYSVRKYTLSTLNTELYYSILNTIMTSINLCPNMLYFNFALLFCKLCMNFSYPRCTVLNLQIQFKMCAETCVGPHVKCQCCPQLTILVVCWRILVGISGMENVMNVTSKVVSCICYRQVDINSHCAWCKSNCSGWRTYFIFCMLGKKKWQWSGLLWFLLKNNTSWGEFLSDLQTKPTCVDPCLCVCICYILLQ